LGINHWVDNHSQPAIAKIWNLFQVVGVAMSIGKGQKLIGGRQGFSEPGWLNVPLLHLEAGMVREF
jgi:hypothetical protein